MYEQKNKMEQLELQFIETPKRIIKDTDKILRLEIRIFNDGFLSLKYEACCPEMNIEDIYGSTIEEARKKLEDKLLRYARAIEKLSEIDGKLGSHLESKLPYAKRILEEGVVFDREITVDRNVK